MPWLRRRPFRHSAARALDSFAIAAWICSAPKSGHRQAVKYNSGYATCQSRKLLIRTSPPVRMKGSDGTKSSPCAWTGVFVEVLRAMPSAIARRVGLHDVPAAAVVEGHRQRDARLCAVSPRPGPRLRAPCRRPALRSPTMRMRTPSSASLVRYWTPPPAPGPSGPRPRRSAASSSRTRTRTP